MYATIQDIADSYGAARLAMLADTDGDGAADDPKVTRALDDASALIDGYISQRYPLPLPRVPAVLREACVGIAVYKLSTDPTLLTEDVRARYEDALRFLRDVASAKAALGLPALSDGAATGTAATASPQTVIVDSEPRMFSRRSLRGL